MISEELKSKIWKLRQQGFSILQISIQLKIGKATVYDWCNKFDPNKEYNLTYKKINKEDRKKLIEAYLINYKIKDVEKLFPFLKKQTIRLILISDGVWVFKKKNETKEEISRRKSLNVINWKNNNKKKLIEYKGGSCEYCGYNKCNDALEFHHIDPSSKDFDISSNSYSFIKMKLEVDKCLLLCANCHREEHFKLKQKQITKINKKVTWCQEMTTVIKHSQEDYLL